MDCTSQETIECLPVLIELNKYSHTYTGGGANNDNSLMLWQVKLAISVVPYCDSLKENFLEGLQTFVTKKISGKNKEQKRELFC